MHKKKRILLTGGGSGGHIMPNLAIADNLCGDCCGDYSRDNCGENCGDNSGSSGGVDILYIGSRGKMDKKLVESAGIRFKSIFTGKLRRYFSWRNFVDPIFVIFGFLQSVWIIITFWPHAVFCKGGFVSIPVAFAAFIFRRSIVLHESDAVMGLSNRIAAKLATKVCIGFPLSETQNSKLKTQKIEFTGNPVRLSILDGDKGKGYQITGFRPERPVVLVWGGSQGAVEVNEMVKKSYPHLKSVFQIIHITGHGKMTDIHDEFYAQFQYLNEELKHVYAITDYVIGRFGANSLYELALMRKPNILIPLQSSAHNHQQLNAEYFEKEGASIILRNNSLHEVLIALHNNEQKIKTMKEALSRVARPDAAEHITRYLL